MYSEALPILYGKNKLSFYIGYFIKPIRPFLKDHLSLVKRVHVNTSPYLYDSTRKMGKFLSDPFKPGMVFTELTICIHIDRDEKFRCEDKPLPSPGPNIDRFLFGANPVATALFSFRAVEKLQIK